MAITKPPVLPAWAESNVGDTDHVVQPTNPEIEAGWPQSTTPPSRQRFNWILNFCANAVRYFCRAGLPDYDAGETYVIGDLVRGDNGRIYRSQVNSNTANTPSSSATQWGSPLVPTPAADDNSFKIASTAYVLGQISVTAPVMASTAAVGTSLKFARADHRHPSDTSKANTTGTYLSMTVGAATSAASVPFTGVTGKPTTTGGYGITDAITTANIGAQSVNFATTAGRAFPRRSDGTSIEFIWSGQAGQPNWLLGSNDGVNFRAYNPANFHVNQADVAVTQPAGTNNTTIATTAFVQAAASSTSSAFTPAGFVGTNISSVTPGPARYIRAGQQVFVTGVVTVVKSASGDMEFGLAVPVGASFSAVTDLSGVGSTYTGSGVLSGACPISANVASDRASFRGNIGGPATYTINYSYAYTI